MTERLLPTRRLVAYAAAESFAEGTLVILRHLGCRIQTPSEFAQEMCERDMPMAAPDLYLAEVKRLPELQHAVAQQVVAPAPVVVLTRDRDRAVDDPSIVATLRSPAGMHDLYRVVQQIFEETPRSTPRVETDIAVVCRLAGRKWEGRVVTVSENGCLLRTDEAIELGAELLLTLPLPGSGTVNLRAESAYQLKSDVGLVFSSTSPKIRESISGFVARTLLESSSRMENPATP